MVRMRMVIGGMAALMMLVAATATPLYAANPSVTPPKPPLRYTEPVRPPLLAAGASLAVTATTGRVALPSDLSLYPALSVFNSGAVPVFFKLGGSGVTAVVTDIPIAAGQWMCFRASDAYLAAITASGTATLYVYQSAGCPIH